MSSSVTPGSMLLAALAVATGITLSQVRGRRLPLAPRTRLGLALGAFVGAMVGAKLPFLLTDLPAFLDGSGWLRDGRTLVTGLAGGYLGVEVAKWVLGVRAKTGDAFALPVAASLAIGRLACFAGGCCFGRPCDLPWAVRFADGVPRHPTQLYEALFHLGMVGVLWRLERDGRLARQRMKFYVLAYFAWRFATEWLRPEPILALGLTVYQLAVLALAPLFGLLWWRDRAPCERMDPGRSSAELE